MLLAVYGDSLSMPRKVLGVSREETYAEILLRGYRSAGHDAVLYNRSIAGVPVAKVKEQFSSDRWYFGPSAPSACVIQVGIVDCAPRPVTSDAKDRIAKLPSFIRVPIIAAIRRSRPVLVEHGIYSQETPPDAFRATLQSFAKEAGDAFDRVAVVNICPNHPNIERRSPKMPECIDAYNAIIESVVAEAALKSVRLADVCSAVRSAGVDGHVNPNDGHHITTAAHRIYAAVIRTALQEAA